MKYVKISDVASVVTGGTPSTSIKEYWTDGNIPWLQSGCCQNCEVNSASKYITQLGYDNSSVKMMPSGTVLIALTGATAGKIGYLNIEACGNQSITGILPSKQLNQKYLYYYLRTIREKILSDCVGGAQPHISQGYVKNILIPLRPLSEQKIIAEVLEIADRRLAILQRKQQLLDDLIKARFCEMFGDPSRGDKIKTNKKKIGEIASVTKLAGFEFTKYIHYKDEGDIIMLRGLNCKNGHLVLNDIKWIDQATSDALPRSKLFNGDILMTYAGTIGDVAMVDKDNAYHLAPNVGKISINNHDEVNPVYLTQLFLNTHDYIMSFASKVAQASINMQKIRDFEYYFPPIEHQNQFADFVKHVERIKRTTQESLKESELLLKSLMQEYYK